MRDLPTPAGSSPLAKESLDGTHVLVVDDDADVLFLVEKFLTNANAIVRTAGSAAAAFSVLETFTPDVIVSDIEMPGADGFQLMRSLREGRKIPSRVPAIALTAQVGTTSRTRAIAAGFDMHMTKPMRAMQLITAIREALDRAERPIAQGA